MLKSCRCDDGNDILLQRASLAWFWPPSEAPTIKQGGYWEVRGNKIEDMQVSILVGTMVVHNETRQTDFLDPPNVMTACLHFIQTRY